MFYIHRLKAIIITNLNLDTESTKRKKVEITKGNKT